MKKFICIHGHFYQPPRENAWLEYVEQQDSAYPYHDWNERITAECYAPNMASRILNEGGKITDIVNNYSRISFNIGPTLLSWLEHHTPDVYSAILEADKLSIERFSGHGAALAQVYNHMIMPLANLRDKITQVRWGIGDFRARFKRFPEGMWLPETAVDTETLEVLAGEGIRFTILAPHQALRVRKLGRGGRWQDVSGGKVDPTMPYLCRLPSGRKIVLFFYDGPMSQDIAFGGLLSNGEYFAKRLMSGFNDADEPQLVHIATDGETYGHHHRYGEMALSYCLHHIENHESADITIYPEFLSRFQPVYEAEIVENSSWSCIHGVGRWKENCGCHSGMNPKWNQQWRKPLREALDWLRESMIPFYSDRMKKFTRDPWSVRDEYIRVVLNRDSTSVEGFLNELAGRDPSADEMRELMKLLELQRNAMLMYTSCGWFFDEISGIETTQIMQYAARVMQIAEFLGEGGLEDEFMRRIEAAPSNVFANGREPYEKYVVPSKVDLLRVGAHYAVSSLFEKYPESTAIYCYTADSEQNERHESGRYKLAMGLATITSNLTYSTVPIVYSVVHLGDHNIYGGIREYTGDGYYDRLRDEMKGSFEKGDMPDMIRLMEKFFGTHSYSMRHLFKDDQRKILEKSQILRQPLLNAESFYRQIYENNYTMIAYVQELNIPVPKPLMLAVEYTINAELQRMFENTGEPVDTESLTNLSKQIKRWKIDIDTTSIGRVVTQWMDTQMEKLYDDPGDLDRLAHVESVAAVLQSFRVQWNFWKAQNLYFTICQTVRTESNVLRGVDAETAASWKNVFKRLGAHFNVNLEC
jgi:alpha-amylase/alpha-mannosidase (GH57 family)